MNADIEQWLSEVRTAALVGSARREPPLVPVALGVAPGAGEEGREQRLLASAAIADALTRGGARVQPPGVALPAAPPEVRSPTGGQATQLLHLLLTQPPVSKPVRDDLVVEWLRLADSHTQRVAWWLLPTLLDHASTRPSLARALGGAIGTRGSWLIRLNPAWVGFVSDDTSEHENAASDWVESWPTLPSAQAIQVFAAGRRRDPAAARELLQSQWHVVPAKVRAAALQSFQAGLSLADEPMLERALDDRAKTVREVAVPLLDQLPESARGARMAERLTSLVRVRRGLRATFEVDVPEDPDESGIRDGLVVATSAGIQPRAQWLATIIRGAPLSAWTGVSGRKPAETVKMMRDPDVLNALTETVAARGDEEWASALFAAGSDAPGLVAHLPAAERREWLLVHLTRKTVSYEAREALLDEPRPWDLALGRTVLKALARPDGDSLAAHVAATLPTALPLALAPEVTSLVTRLGPEARARKVLAETLQIHAFRTSLTEAFS